jgi:signal peptidase II
MVQRKYLILLSLSGMLVAFDQLLKFLVVSRFKLGDNVELVRGFFTITRVHNSGAAFGLLANVGPSFREPFLLFVPSAMLIVILGFFFRLHENQRLGILSLSLIVGGALGNFADRLRLGYVVDFLDFHWHSQFHFPAFNLADAAISGGVLLLAISMVYEPEPDSRPLAAVRNDH